MHGGDPSLSVTFHSSVHQSIFHQSCLTVRLAHFSSLQLCHESLSDLIPVTTLAFCLSKLTTWYSHTMYTQLCVCVCILFHLTFSLLIMNSLPLIKYLIACLAVCMVPSLCSSNQQVADAFVAYLAVQWIKAHRETHYKGWPQGECKHYKGDTKV